MRPSEWEIDIGHITVLRIIGAFRGGLDLASDGRVDSTKPTRWIFSFDTIMSIRAFSFSIRR